MPLSEYVRRRRMTVAAPGFGSSDTKHGVAICRDTPAADDLATIEVPAGRWAVFQTAGRYPNALHQAWAATATEWFTEAVSS